MSDIDFAVLIPARLASTRLPRKLLLRAGGKTVLQWTWEVAVKSGASYIAVVTGDKEIRRVARGFGAEVVMSKREHDSGTSRSAEAALELGSKYPVVVNLQADEPLADPAWLSGLAKEVLWRRFEISTLVCPAEPAEIKSRDVVKCVRSSCGKALYFSRLPLPTAVRHLGIYAFRADVLARLGKLRPSKHTVGESLEQLTWLEHYPIWTLEVGPHGASIDTAEDLERFRAAIAKRPLCRPVQVAGAAAG